MVITSTEESTGYDSQTNLSTSPPANRRTFLRNAKSNVPPPTSPLSPSFALSKLHIEGYSKTSPYPLVRHTIHIESTSTTPSFNSHCHRNTFLPPHQNMPVSYLSNTFPNFCLPNSSQSEMNRIRLIISSPLRSTYSDSSSCLVQRRSHATSSPSSLMPPKHLLELTYSDSFRRKGEEEEGSTSGIELGRGRGRGRGLHRHEIGVPL